jgi:hypothetical protein
MNRFQQPSARQDLVGVIDPDANAAATLLTAWVDVGVYGGFLALISAGDLGTNGTLDAKLVQATSSGGAGAKDITGKAITQFTQAGADFSNKQAFIDCLSDALDKNNGFHFIALSMTGAVATSDYAGLLFGFDPKYKSAHAASVVQTV